MTNDPIIIASYARTPIGSFQGQFSSITAPQLGGVAIQAALERSGVEPSHITDVVMGCVLPAGQGQAPARQAAINAGIPYAAGATTINKMCGSGMKAIIFAHDGLLAGSNKITIAGGLESMTNAPYLLKKARSGVRLGHDTLYDHMFLDGLEDAYDQGNLMGVFAESCAAEYGFTREQQDEFALESLSRAQEAIQSGAFENEIAPVSVSSRQGLALISHDETPGNARPDKIPLLKPAFKADGTVTAANSSSISDGAAALVLMRESTAIANNIKPLAVIHGHATHSQEPALFTTAPIGAINRLFEVIGWTPAEVDLYEINEAFAVVTMAAMQTLALDHQRVNVNGGACALGHPIGASGARIVATLMSALQLRGLKKGIAALCIGGGEATALALELV